MRAPRKTTDGGLYPRRWQALIVLALSLLVVSVDNTILNVALPTIQKDLDASSSELQWIVDSYLLVFAGSAAWLPAASATGSGAGEPCSPGSRSSASGRSWPRPPEARPS